LNTLEENNTEEIIEISPENSWGYIPVFLTKKSLGISVRNSFILSLIVHFIGALILYLLTITVIFLSTNLNLLHKPEPKVRDINFILTKPVKHKVKLAKPNISKKTPRTEGSKKHAATKKNVQKKSQSIKSSKSAQKKEQAKKATKARNSRKITKSEKQFKTAREPEEFSLSFSKIKPLASSPSTSYDSSGDAAKTASSGTFSHAGSGTDSDNTYGSGRRRGSGLEKETTNNMLSTYNISPYINELQRNIRWNWKPPKGQQNKKVELFLRISKDGKLMILNIKKTSLNAEVDNAATSAVKKTLPLNPLPSQYKKSYLDVVFVLDYNVVSVKR
jgi:hypothetical protein